MCTHIILCVLYTYEVHLTIPWHDIVVSDSVLLGLKDHGYNLHILMGKTLSLIVVLFVVGKCYDHVYSYSYACMGGQGFQS